MPNVNFSKEFLDNLQRQKNHTAIIWNNQKLSNQQLCDLILDTASDLIKHGVASDDRVMMRAEDSPQWISHLLALIYIGAVPIILSPLYLPTRAIDIIKQTRCKFVVIDDNDKLKNQDGLGCCPIIIDRKIPICSRKNIDAHIVDPGKIGLIIASSGSTTGKNKLIAHRHSAWRQALNIVSKIYDYNIDVCHVVYSSSRLSFQYAWHHLLSALENGSQIILSSSIIAGARLLNFIEKHHITRFVTTPRILATFLKIKNPDLKKLRSLSTIMSGGEAIPDFLEKDILDRYGYRVYNGQGSAEVITYWCAQTPDSYQFGTMGTKVPGADIRLVDAQGQDVGPNSVGEIWVKMPTVFIGYLDDDHETLQRFDQGWFKTNDLAKIDAQGFYHCVGRKNNVKKINGLFVFPHEVESALLKIPQIDECMVAICEIDGVDTVVANLIASKQDDLVHLQEIRNFLHSTLETHMIPKIIKYVSRIPKTITGKKITSLIET